MNGQNSNGFTVIEVMLFLAVSAILTVALLAGSGVAIGQQRYQDSVSSLKVLIQSQYNQANNVVNDRIGQEACTGSNVSAPVSSPEARGTSDCVIVGRLLTVDGDGSSITTSTVLASRSSAASEETYGSNIEELRSYDLAVSPVGQEETQVAWGNVLSAPGDDEPRELAMLIIRSPLSGSIMTFTAAEATTNVESLVTPANAAAQRDLCVVAENDTFLGHRMAVRVSAHATSQGAIEIPPEDDDVCA